ncbi:hypothetical protein JZ751_014101 [Albula glossodonta]|uniref:Uncharacterized protein n=1 Tax=Albula glossodonta TaxID=121402 RepID=A0A8T2NSF3_9TELE|nr:hypothetical protein JZ751_014101 [Albula glossodonta]
MKVQWRKMRKKQGEELWNVGADTVDSVSVSFRSVIQQNVPTTVSVNTLTYGPLHRPECTSVQVNTLTYRPLHRPECTSVQVNTLTYRPLHRPECTSVQVNTLTYRPLHRPACTSVQAYTVDSVSVSFQSIIQQNVLTAVSVLNTKVTRIKPSASGNTRKD